jgi:hypothetical protein
MHFDERPEKANTEGPLLFSIESLFSTIKGMREEPSIFASLIGLLSSRVKEGEVPEVV